MIPPKPITPHPFPDGGHCLRLGFLGRLVPQKNLVYLLEAFEHLVAGRAGACSEPVSWELHLFGDGPTKQELESAAAARGLESRVHFHGAVPHDAVAAAIDQCHLFAFSSVSEGQCLAALEILSRGRPIVATPVGAFPEFLTAPELGQLCPPGQRGAVRPDVASGRIAPAARAIDTAGRPAPVCQSIFP